MLRRSEDAVSPVLATVLLIAIVVVLAGIVLAIGFAVNQGRGDPPRAFAFTKDDASGEVRVVTAPHGVPWSEIRVTGCSTVPAGTVDPGDAVTGCSGHVTLVDTHTNTLLASYDFP